MKRKILGIATALLYLGGSIVAKAGVLPEYQAEIKAVNTKQVGGEYLFILSCKEVSNGKIELTLLNPFTEDPHLIDKFLVVGKGECGSPRGGLAKLNPNEKVLYVVWPHRQ